MRRKDKKVKDTADDVLLADVRKLLSDHMEEGVVIHPDTQQTKYGLQWTQIEVPITMLSSTGDGLGLSQDNRHVYVVPFTVPGDVVRAKIVTHWHASNYSLTDFISIVKPSPLRDDTRIQCQYFTRCSGCQFQMLAYEEQLAHKKTVIERAYRNFSNVLPELVPPIGDTVPSPLQYEYRTKLTPHFDGPGGAWKSKKPRNFAECPPIGFNLKFQRKVLDVEDCPIGTPTLRDGMKQERKRVAENLKQYQRGATILLRENTSRTPLSAKKTDEDVPNAAENGVDPSCEQGPVSSSQPQASYTETKTYITDNNAVSKEYVDDYSFENIAGAFFQNNNSILPDLTQYIRDHIKPSSVNAPAITNLLDAYCGSGLFTITLSRLFERSIGVDIADTSIRCARRNAEANGAKNARFIAATASQIFAELDIDPDATAVVIDPPRKGCDTDFLNQLLDFGPQRIVYVSCNVHTQARDVGVLVEGRTAKDGSNQRYRIESIRGFDFFPQAGHVEGVAILSRIDSGPKTEIEVP